jgi:hypothetical protein
MHMRLKGTILAAVVAAAGLWWTAVPMSGQQAGGALPRNKWDNKPTLEGIWQYIGTANWNIEGSSAQPGPYPALLGAWGAQPAGLGIVLDGPLPYKPEALKKREQNFANRMKSSVTNDPSRYDTGDSELLCYRPGIPRANYMPFPFQIFQNPDQILFVYEYKRAMRSIYMDPSPLSKEEAPVDSWMGWHTGRWDGDTLVVTSTAMHPYTWFDRAGNHHSNNMVVTERWSQRGVNHLNYEATINDPDTFTRAWKMGFPVYRRLEPNIQILEFNCVPFVEELIYGPLGLYKPGPRYPK